MRYAIVAGLLVVVVAVILVVRARRGGGQAGLSAAGETGGPTDRDAAAPARIASLADAVRRQRAYRYFLELADQRGVWVEAASVSETDATLPDGRTVPHASVTAYLVCYPNGEIIDSHEPFGLLPTGVTELRTHDNAGLRPTIAPDELAAGRARLDVSHSRLRVKNNTPGYFDHATTLTNRTNQRLRVTQFSPYGPSRSDRALTAGVAYTAEQFAQWYGVAGADRWIEPGQSVSDPDNYSTGDATWVYYVETEAGEQFVTGARVKP